MLQLNNTTPYPAAHALFTDQQGGQRLSVALKATFVLPGPGEEVKPAEEQRPVLSADEFFGDPAQTGIRYPADLVIDKPATDIGLVGSAYSPGGIKVTRLLATLQVGAVNKSIGIIGDRYWQRHAFGSFYTITDPTPFTSLPIRYEHAYGGRDQGEEYAPNPVGAGFVVNGKNAHGLKLPNIEETKHLITKYSQRPPVAGFGFMTPVCESRRKYNGTLDGTWPDKRFPYLPPDFNPRFFNVAHPDLVAPGYLQGAEQVRLVNLSAVGTLEFKLPKLDFLLSCRLFNVRKNIPLHLWTVIFEPDEKRFSLTWGASFDTEGQENQIKEIRIEDKTGAKQEEQKKT